VENPPGAIQGKQMVFLMAMCKGLIRLHSQRLVLHLKGPKLKTVQED
jgi:hypothetical protein